MLRARKVVSPEIVSVLDSRVPREITDEILGWVVNGRVAKAFREIVTEVRKGCWFIEGELKFYSKTIRFTRGISKKIIYCKECAAVRSFAWMQNGNTLHYMPYPICTSKCRGIKLSRQHRYRDRRKCISKTTIGVDKIRIVYLDGRVKRYIEI